MMSRPSMTVARPAWAHALLLLAGLLLACGDGPAEPDPPGVMRNGPPLVRTTSWVASEPAFQQSERFFYDENGRLERWEFSHNLSGTWRTTMRKELLYRNDGLHAGHDHYTHLGGEWWLTRTVRYDHDESRGLPVVVRIEEFHEGSGTVVEGTWHIDYDGADRIVEMRSSEADTLRFTWDTRSDIVRMESEDRGHGRLVARLTYGSARNPLDDLPPQLGVAGGSIFAPELFSRHLSESWENGLEGEPPAAMATATIDTRDDGSPVRREYTLWNTTDPDVRTVVVTTYEYDDSSE